MMDGNTWEKEGWEPNKIKKCVATLNYAVFLISHSDAQETYFL
jgi:hypothetical protein